MILNNCISDLDHHGQLMVTGGWWANNNAALKSNY
jgi:hypothetical protein